MHRITDISKKLAILLVIFFISIYMLFLSPSPEIFDRKAHADSLNITNVVMQYVKRYYANQSLIEPKAMLITGLDKLERILDQVLVVYPNGEEGKSFRVQVGEKESTFNMSKIRTLDDVTNKLEEVFNFIMPNLPENSPEIIDIEYAVVDEMLKTLDPHSGVITPQVYKEFMIETEGSFGGLGIVIGIRDGELTVISPIEGTPAYRMGIKPNDKIVQIGHESTINMSLIEAVSKLRGRKGTEVRIFIARDTFAKPKEVKIVRDTIKIESVETFELDNNIKYVRIRDFQKNTLNSIIENLNNTSGNKPEGVILDLRGNPGGLLDQAERISDLFLTSGVIVTTKIGNSSKPYHANDKDHGYDGNVVVLVDSGSASASEIVAGALKNNERAIIVGERTFGKGSVQQIFDLNDGSALKLTIAQYLTPGDKSIQDVGVTPDIILHPAIISEDFIIFDTNTRERKVKDNKIQSNIVQEEPVYSIRYLIERDIDADNDEMPTPEEALTRQERKDNLSKDFYVNLAKNIILSSNVPSRKESLGIIQNDIYKISKVEEDKIVEKWNDMGIDWTLGPKNKKPPSLSIQVNPRLPAGKAGEKMILSVDVTNIGTEPIYRLHATTKSENKVLEDKELIYGNLAPGEKRSWSTTFEIPKWSLTREDEIKLDFQDAYDSNINDYSIKTKINELPKPLYAFNYEIVDDGRFGSHGNGNGIPEAQEKVVLSLKIRNIGEGASEKTILTLKNLSGETIFLEKGRVEFEQLESQELRQATLSFDVQKANTDIELELQIIDEIFREGLTSKIELPMSNISHRDTLGNSSIKVNTHNTPIRAGSFPEAPIIAITQHGALFTASGQTDEWSKIKLDEESYGWINNNKVTASGTQTSTNQSTQARYNEIFEAPSIIRIPRLPVSTHSQMITLNGNVNDIDGIELVSVFVGDDKVALLPSNANEVPVSLQLKLNDNINLITIIAKDSKGLYHLLQIPILTLYRLYHLHCR